MTPVAENTGAALRDREGEERQINEKKDEVVRHEGNGGGDGHVLDLDIAVKYGVLGGVGGGRET